MSVVRASKETSLARDMKEGLDLVEVGNCTNGYIFIANYLYNKQQTKICISIIFATKGLSKKATCLRGRVAEWPCGRVAEINFGYFLANWLLLVILLILYYYFNIFKILEGSFLGDFLGLNF